MNAPKMVLLNAILFTLCALVWLINGVLQLSIGADSPAQVLLLAACVLFWTCGAVFWWLYWRRMSKRFSAG